MAIFKFIPSIARIFSPPYVDDALKDRSKFGQGKKHAKKALPSEFVQTLHFIKLLALINTEKYVANCST